MNKGDILVIVLLLIVAFAFFVLGPNQSHESLIAVIYEDGREVRKIDLNDVKESYDLSLNEERYLVVRIEPGRIRYLTSSCKDKICINTSWLNKQGDFAACVPNRSAIKIVGDNQ